MLWVGTPAGTLVEIDIEGKRAVRHDELAGSPVTAPCANAAGDLVVAVGACELALMSVQADPTERRPAETRVAHKLVAAFLDSASEAPTAATWRSSWS